jgi:hypothetical protein
MPYKFFLKPSQPYKIRIIRGYKSIYKHLLLLIISLLACSSYAVDLFRFSLKIIILLLEDLIIKWRI